MEISTELQKFNITDAAISKLASDYMALTINGLEDKKGFKAVHAARMDVVSRRTSVEKIRKELKADSLEYGRRVDAEAKRITGLLAPVEDHLVSEEKKITDEQARIKKEAEEKEAARIQARIDILFMQFDAKFNGQMYSAYDLQIPAAMVKVANDEQFNGIVSQLREKKEIEDARIAAEEAARKAEQERLAKIAAEQEAERKRLEAIAREQEEAARKVKEEQEALEREKQRLIEEEAARKAAIEREEKRKEDEKRRAEELEKARKEAAEKALKEAEEKAKKEAEEKAEAERQAKLEAERQEALKPDKEKLLSYADAIDTVKIPSLTSPEAKTITEETTRALSKIADNIRKRTRAL